MKTLFSTLFFASLLFFSCNQGTTETADTDTPVEETQSPKVKMQEVNYSIDTLKMDGYVAYDDNLEGKRPAILVIPEWWGLNDYAKRRSNELAELGYIAMAVDLYGNGRRGANPQEAGALATPFYQNPQMAKAHFDAAVEQLKKFPQADTENMGAIGYCFGGAMVLNVARLGEDLKGVVSFHGNLVGVPANPDLLKAKVLVLHGEADQFVPLTEVETFKEQMESIGADYTIKTYPDATHAFTNPAATENGEKFSIPIAYNAAADTASWQEMKAFFAGVFE